MMLFFAACWRPAQPPEVRGPIVAALGSAHNHTEMTRSPRQPLTCYSEALRVAAVDGSRDVEGRGTDSKHKHLEMKLRNQ